MIGEMRFAKLVAGSAAFGLFVAVSGAQSYHVQNLGELGGDSSRATGLNDAGEVVGSSYLPGSADPKAFRWTPQDGMVQLFGYQLEGEDAVHDLNNSGVAVGKAADGSSYTSVKWTPGQATQSLPFPSTHGIGMDINEAGHVGGIYYDQNFTAQSVFMVGNQTWTMGLAPGQAGSFVTSINNQDILVGYRFTSPLDQPYEAVLWRPFFGVTSLGNFGGHSVARGINDETQVTGWSQIGDSDIDHAFYWSQDTGMISIHGLADHESSHAEAINGSGTIVGTAVNDGFFDGTGFVWNADTGMLQLNTLLDAESQGWDIITAEDINESGQIVGYGIHPRFGGRAVLLTPVPEPGTIAAIGLGVAALLRRRRKVS